MSSRNKDSTFRKQLGTPDVRMIKDMGGLRTPAVKYVTEVINIPDSPWNPRERRQRRYDATIDDIMYVTEVITIRDSPKSPSPSPSRYPTTPSPSPDRYPTTPSPDDYIYSPNYQPCSPSSPSSPRDIIKLIPEHLIKREAITPPCIQMKEPEEPQPEPQPQPQPEPQPEPQPTTPAAAAAPTH